MSCSVGGWTSLTTCSPRLSDDDDDGYDVIVDDSDDDVICDVVDDRRQVWCVHAAAEHCD